MQIGDHRAFSAQILIWTLENDSSAAPGLQSFIRDQIPIPLTFPNKPKIAN